MPLGRWNSAAKLCTLQNGKLVKLCFLRPWKIFVSTVAQHCAQPEHHTLSMFFSWTTKSSVPEALSHTQPWLDSQKTGRLLDSEGLWQAVRHVKKDATLNFHSPWETNTFEQSAGATVKCHLDFNPNYFHSSVENQQEPSH